MLYLWGMIIATELKNKVGIYCILNIVNNKKYIGSSKNIWNRLQKHFSKELGVTVSSIIRVLQGTMQQCKGYIFYKEGCKEIRTVKINPNTGKPFRKPAPVKSI